MVVSWVRGDVPAGADMAASENVNSTRRYFWTARETTCAPNSTASGLHKGSRRPTTARTHARSIVRRRTRARREPTKGGRGARASAVHYFARRRYFFARAFERAGSGARGVAASHRPCRSAGTRARRTMMTARLAAAASNGANVAATTAGTRATRAPTRAAADPAPRPEAASSPPPSRRAAPTEEPRPPQRRVARLRERRGHRRGRRGSLRQGREILAARAPEARARPSAAPASPGSST